MLVGVIALVLFVVREIPAPDPATRAGQIEDLSRHRETQQTLSELQKDIEESLDVPRDALLQRLDRERL